MCKAQNNFQLLLVKLFSQTYYCSDTKFWPEKCLLCNTSVYPGPPPPVYFSGIFPPPLLLCCLLFVPFYQCSDQVISASPYIRQFRKPQNFRTKVYQGTLFVQLIYSFFSCDHVPTNSVAPFSAYKDTCNPQFLYSL